MSKTILSQNIIYKHPSYYQEKKMLHAMQRGFLDKAVNFLDEINKIERAVLADSPLRSLKNSIIGTCTLFTRAAIEANVPPEISFSHSDEHILKIEAIGNIKALAKYEYNMLEDFTKLIIKYRQTNYSKLTVKIIEFIEENLTEAITLEDISHAIKKNPSYISNAFKKDVGMNISSYIQMRRIEESIYYLLYTNNSIYDISQILGFSHSSHYSRIFKRIHGITPRMYREKPL